ncbi:TPA: YjeJ family protein [Klebsiella quasipneumoniae]
MTKKISGINTGAIKFNDKFCLMAVKINDEDSTCHTYYMQLSVMLDFIILMRDRAHKAVKKLQENGEIYKAKIIAEHEKLAMNIPAFEEEELQQPNQANLIISITPKFADEHCTLIVVLQNEHILSLTIPDIQAEFFILAVQQALSATNDTETLKQIASILDFLMLYFVDLSDLSYLNYKEINHEPWKQSLFAQHLAVLYSFEKEEGEEILAGAVIKTNAPPDTEEAKNLIKRIALIAPGLREIVEKRHLAQTFMKVIPADQTQVLTLDECMRPLYEFCLETQKTL